MSSTAPYVTPQERRRRKALERQIPQVRPAPDERPADGERARQEAVPVAAAPRS